MSNDNDLLFCPHCGGRNEPDAKFCGFCGRAVDEISPGAAAAAPPVQAGPQAQPARRGRGPLVALAGLAVIAVLAVFAFSASAARWLGSVVHRAPAGPAAIQPARPGNFDVVLDGAGDQKIRVVRTVQEITGLTLAQSKALVEGAPVAIKTKISQQDAEQIRQRLERLDAPVRVVPAGTVARAAPAPSQPSVPATAVPGSPSTPPAPQLGPGTPATPIPGASAPSTSAPPPPVPAVPAPAALAVDSFTLTSITPRSGADGLHVDVRGSFRLSGSASPVAGQLVPAWRKSSGALQYGTPSPLTARSGAVPVAASVFVPRPLPPDSVQVVLAVRFAGREWLSSPGSVALAAQAPAAPKPSTPPQASATRPPTANNPPAAGAGALPPSGSNPAPGAASAPGPSKSAGASPPSETPTQAAATRLKLTATTATHVAAGQQVSFDLSYVVALEQRVNADYALAWRMPDGTLHYGTYRSVTATPGPNSVRGLGLKIGTDSSGTTLPVYGVVRINGTIYRSQMPVLLTVAPRTQATPASPPPAAGTPLPQLSTVSRLALRANGPTTVTAGTVIPLIFTFDLVNVDAADVQATLAWRVETGPLTYGQWTTLHAKRGPNSINGTFTASSMPSGTVVSVHVVVRYAGATYTSNPVPVTIR